MTPIFVVVTTGGDVYACTTRDNAKSIANGTIVKVSGLPAKLKILTLSGAGSPYTLTTATNVTAVSANKAEDKENISN